MNAYTKSPSYLVRNRYSYCFRMIVPADLQKFVRRKELRYTLKTGYLGVAKQKARFVAGQVQLIFRFLRKGGALLGKLSDDQIHKLVHRYIKTSIESWDKNFYEKWDDDPPGLRPYEATDFFEDIRDQLIDRLNNGDFRMLEKPIGELLKKNGINDMDKDSLEYRKLCAEIHKAEIQLMPMQKRHMRCDFSYKNKLPDIFPEVFPKIKQASPEIVEQNSESLQKVFDAYWNENLRHWKPRTETQYKTCHNHLLKFLGHNRPVHTIDYDDGKDYKNKLLSTITNRGTQMSAARVDLYLGYASQVFKWGRKNYRKDIEINPFEGLQLGKKARKRPDTQRDAFSMDDLKKLFVDSRYFGQDKWGKANKPHFFWIPLLGLYTGAREEEIGQLYVDDIQQVEEVRCFYSIARYFFLAVHMRV